MVRFGLAGLLGMGLLLLATGCGEGEAPTAVIKSAAVDHVGPEGFTFNFVIDLHNPNDFVIPLQQATYSLLIGNTVMLQGTATPTGTIPARGNLVLKLPVGLSWANILGAEEAIRSRKGDVPFTLDGVLSFDATQLGENQPDSLPLHYSGIVPVRQVLRDPMVILRSPTVQGLAHMALNQIFGQASQPASEPQ